MRHLPKHLRPRYRYIAIEVETWPDVDLDRKDVRSTMQSVTRSLLGDAECAAVDLHLIRADLWRGGGFLIVRVRRGTVEQARAAIATVTTIADHPVRVGVRGVGGTVRSTESKYRGGPSAPTETEQIERGGKTGTAFHREDRVDVKIEGEYVGTTPEEI